MLKDEDGEDVLRVFRVFHIKYSQRF